MNFRFHSSFQTYKEFRDAFERARAVFSKTFPPRKHKTSKCFENVTSPFISYLSKRLANLALDAGDLFDTAKLNLLLVSLSIICYLSPVSSTIPFTSSLIHLRYVPGPLSSTSSSFSNNQFATFPAFFL